MACYAEKWWPTSTTTAAQKKLFENAKDDIKIALSVCKEGTEVGRLMGTISESTGSNIPFRQMGFDSVQHFLFHIDDILEVRELPYNDRLYLFVRESAVSAECKHLRSLVQEQANTKTNKQGPRPTLRNTKPVSSKVLLKSGPPRHHAQPFLNGNSFARPFNNSSSSYNRQPTAPRFTRGGYTPYVARGGYRGSKAPRTSSYQPYSPMGYSKPAPFVASSSKPTIVRNLPPAQRLMTNNFRNDIPNTFRSAGVSTPRPVEVRNGYFGKPQMNGHPPQGSSGWAGWDEVDTAKVPQDPRPEPKPMSWNDTSRAEQYHRLPAAPSVNAFQVAAAKQRFSLDFDSDDYDSEDEFDIVSMVSAAGKKTNTLPFKTVLNQQQDQTKVEDLWADDDWDKDGHSKLPVPLLPMTSMSSAPNLVPKMETCTQKEVAVKRVLPVPSPPELASALQPLNSQLDQGNEFLSHVDKKLKSKVDDVEKENKVEVLEVHHSSLKVDEDMEEEIKIKDSNNSLPIPKEEHNAKSPQKQLYRYEPSKELEELVFRYLEVNRMIRKKNDAKIEMEDSLALNLDTEYPLGAGIHTINWSAHDIHNPSIPILPPTMDFWKVRVLKLTQYFNFVSFQVADTKYQEKTSAVLEEMNSWYKKERKHFDILNNIDINDLFSNGIYAGYDEQAGTWYRVQIDIRNGIKNGMIPVMDIDTGVKSKLKQSNIAYLMSRYGSELLRQGFRGEYLPEEAMTREIGIDDREHYHQELVKMLGKQMKVIVVATLPDSFTGCPLLLFSKFKPYMKV